MTTVNVYLNFNGNCLEAFDFYKSVFGVEFSYLGKFGDMPADESKPLSQEDANRIMHVSLPISSETMLMGSDITSDWSSNYVAGNNFSISITVTSQADADKLFNGLSVGGVVTMPLQHTFWGDYFGMFTDKFGINWMISFNTTKEAQ